jgi:hypothetical protein
MPLSESIEKPLIAERTGRPIAVFSNSYRVENRALHVVVEHAAFVGDLFRRYLEIGGVVRLKAILDAENVQLPMRTDGSGKASGGGLTSRGPSLQDPLEPDLRRPADTQGPSPRWSSRSER